MKDIRLAVDGGEHQVQPAPDRDPLVRYRDGRCNFIARRDGIQAAVAFAIQGVRVYRRSVLTSRKRGFDRPHHCSLPEYRWVAVRVYLEMKRFYFAHRSPA